MATSSEDIIDQQTSAKPVQIYPTARTGVTPFWKEKYEREARKYWDVFYKRHQDKFFKDRHYLEKEWGDHFTGHERKVVLEIGCGAGNTIFPLVAAYPEIFVYACDFSPRAVNLVKTHKEFTESRVDAFVCDLTVDNLSGHISVSSVDIVTMIFVLSAVSPEKMSLVLQNVRKVLKPNGLVLFRDYALGDLAQERFSCKDQRISENFYVRGDGTRAFYFSNDFLTGLFKENGFEVEEYGLCCKQVENRAREITMNRRWVQAAFRLSNAVNSVNSELVAADVNLPCTNSNGLVVKGSAPKKIEDDVEIDMSEDCLAGDMFGLSLPAHELVKIKVGHCSFEIKVLSKEHQHTCKSTGLMLWESARLMASILANNPSIVSGKRVLELGCGCGGICSMVAVESADLVVATDGDAKALDLLTQNVASNLKKQHASKMVTRRLEWGNRDQIRSIKEVNKSGFDVIIGTDVTYVAEAISALFATASELLLSNECETEKQRPALVLCHVLRRVDEPSILSAAAQSGFRLIDRWPSTTENSQGIISSWFPEDTSIADLPSSALNIMYFQKE
uniref:Methyltransferase type 12 domain-containing protein n=1 Tax=Kalanchoe fedtschenkoi TaxID=63787 RepID=A0A7N1A7K5_KALFE